MNKTLKLLTLSMIATIALSANECDDLKKYGTQKDIIEVKLLKIANSQKGAISLDAYAHAKNAHSDSNKINKAYKMCIKDGEFNGILSNLDDFDIVEQFEKRIKAYDNAHRKRKDKKGDSNA